MAKRGGRGARLVAAVLGGALLLAACTSAKSELPAAAPAAPAPAAQAPAGSGTSPSAGPSGSTAEDWPTILAEAKREGVVQCACPPRPDYTRLFKEQFERAYPEIRLEASPATLPDIWARVEKEQEAGQYLWDVYLFGPTLEMFALKNKGGFESFRDYMVGPDVGDESVWEGGWDRAFLDAEKRYIFAFWLNITTDVTINRDLLPTAEISTFDDLLKPEYRGRIVWQDPRVGGLGVSFLTGAYHYKGREPVRQLLVDQQPLLTRGNAEMAEQLVRGGRAISIAALSKDTLVQFEQAGVRLNLQDIVLEDIPSVSNGGQAPAVFKRPPHPNATKVFVNWLLSQPTQDLIARELLQNATRKDVPPFDPGDKPRPGVQYFHTQTEQNMETVARDAQRYARELIP
jgi:ABC-type Fe3+ transport system substrate-binding protein